MNELSTIVNSLLADPLAPARARAQAGGRVVGLLGEDIPMELVRAAGAAGLQLAGLQVRDLMAAGVTVTVAFALYLFMVVSARAEEVAPAATKPDLQTKIEAMQAKLDHAARRANQPAAGSSSVIGLRGSKQEPLSKQLYWKGKQGPVPVSPDEIKEFRAALEQAKAGQIAEANAALKTFLAAHPQSPLKPDAEETLKILTPVS